MRILFQQKWTALHLANKKIYVHTQNFSGSRYMRQACNVGMQYAHQMFWLIWKRFSLIFGINQVVLRDCIVRGRGWNILLTMRNNVFENGSDQNQSDCHWNLNNRLYRTLRTPIRTPPSGEFWSGAGAGGYRAQLHNSKPISKCSFWRLKGESAQIQC